MVLELGFRVKFVCIQNFELILNILEHSKPSISSLKQPGRLAACLLGKTPLTFTDMYGQFEELFCITHNVIKNKVMNYTDYRSVVLLFVQLIELSHEEISQSRIMLTC